MVGMNQFELDKERLQRYLPQLRGCAGLSSEALASKIGLTKQAINYIERHQDKPMTKIQYICIRSVFDEEYYHNKSNINLRDCYDLVFSDASFYLAEKDRIEFAIYQALEDAKSVRKQAKKIARKNKTDGAILDAAKTAVVCAGATSATLAIGGIATATFPTVFPVMLGTALATVTHKMINVGEKTDHSNRASNDIKHPKWLEEALRDDTHDATKTNGI